MAPTSRIPEAFVEALSNARRVLVTTHRSPDGDAAGCALAARKMIQALGSACTVWIPEGVPRSYSFLPGLDEVATGDFPEGTFDVTLVVDTSEPGLLAQPLPGEERRGRILVLDHHLTGGSWGDEIVCVEVAATGELMWELAGLMGFEPDLEFATCVYVAIVTDTGMFRYDLTTPSTHEIAACCLKAGVRPYEVTRHVYESYPAAYLPLWAELLATIELGLDGRFATLTVEADLLEKHGADKDALEEVVGYPRGIEGVEVAALLRFRDGRVRASLRSTGTVNVAHLARQFGGGGHFGAAGCDFDDGVGFAGARTQLEQALEHLLDP